MERGSPSSRSWADMVEEDEAAVRSIAESTFLQLPPLAAAAHAANVLRSSALDPTAEPFLGSPEGRIRFTDSEESYGESDAPTSVGQGMATRPRRKLRRRRRAETSRAPGQRGTAQPASPPRGRLPSLVVHPARMSSEPDEDSFREVHSRWRWRRATVAARPAPADLIGKRFNCFAADHVRADCTVDPRCFNCRQPGHHARDCPLPRVGHGQGGKRGRSPFGAAGAGEHPAAIGPLLLTLSPRVRCRRDVSLQSLRYVTRPRRSIPPRWCERLTCPRSRRGSPWTRRRRPTRLDRSSQPRGR